MESPSALLCDLRPYQKQALHWMVHLEKGPCVDDAATTLHPCWDAYNLADEYAFSVTSTTCVFLLVFISLYSSSVCACRRKFVVYVNAFSGEATAEFPSTLQMSRGGVCFYL